MKKMLKTYNLRILFSVCIIFATSCTHKQDLRIEYGKEYSIDKVTLQDKIKGGWAGQTIGCTYGGPTEFKYKGGLMQDQVEIIWYDDYALNTFEEDPGLYDDVYMDLTFVEVMQKYGINAPASAYATAFANDDYKLWHANQAARYNILHGIMPPASGYWGNNPHADDIDFQIEADFIGMLCPAMPNVALALSDSIGHIMNYGDGWYGGAFVSMMYSLAYICDDIPFIVEEAIKVIPEKSKFRQCIDDVITIWKTNPDDWKQCWFEIDKKHSFDIGCPEGVFNGFNIDARINAAYCVIGLLFGNGDFKKTMDIATRCGQDSDCNPATVAGILGVIKGYSGIPDEWKAAMEKVENLDFPYTSISLNKIYEINLKLIEDVVKTNGNKIENDKYIIKLNKAESLRFEESFAGIKPVEKRVLKMKFNDEINLNFEGNSVVVLGQVNQLIPKNNENYIAHLEAYIDDEKVEDIMMPYDYIKRKYDIFYKYNLPQGKHKLKLKVINPNSNYQIEAKEMVVYEELKTKN
jgi:hypothetical protein